uniref:Uncharacterized protein n=1 Tax=Hyaloperonospora arabidopsidis (strain Emoy2) TaxID=559515 RepID=M4C4U4_HYAAE
MSFDSGVNLAGSQCRVAMSSPARLDVWYSSRSRSHGRRDTYSPRRSRSRHRSSLRPRSPREHSPLHSRRCAPTAWTHSPERHLELRESVRNAAPTNTARVETQSSVCDTGARLVPRASRGPMMLRQWMDPCDQQYDPLSRAPGLPHRQAAVGPRGDNTSVLVAQNDVDEAVNRAPDTQLEAEAALERAAQAENTASEIRQSNRELLERMRNLERQVHGNAQMGTQPRLMALARQERRDGRPTYETRTPLSEPTREA